ncbi:MAG: Hpt domain-containing protein [Treponema sp.]|nr:Hpt domain-containing protein [Treponema sp.]
MAVEKANVLAGLDPEFIKTLRLLFVKNNRNKHEEIVNALERQDIGLAHRLAHTLKSNSAQLGKTDLQKIAYEIELKLKDGQNLVTKEMLDNLGKELNAVINEFSSQVGEAPSTTTTLAASPTAATDVLSAEETRELISKLETLLKMGSPESLKLANDLHRFPGETVQVLLEQIENFDFDKALITLIQIKNKLDIK